MLAFQTLRARAVAAGMGEDAAFLVGFQEVYRWAALLPVGVIVVLNLSRALRGRG
jgi:hypothetical protein